MADDWEADSSETAPKATIIPKKRWEGEDEEENQAPDDWEESSSEEEETKPVAVPVAPPRKRGTLKAKLAEKEAAKALANNVDGDSDIEDVTNLDPVEKKRLDKERELKSDLSNAAELFGIGAIESSPSTKDIESILSFNPRTKDEFQQLSSRIIELIMKRHESKPLYPSFVEHHVKALAQSLKDVEIRKAASALTTLANEKQKEQRDKASGKKKSKGAAKPILGAAKSSNKFDTSLYDEALDDFGTHAEDFM